jgi:hypothetical protein
MAKAADEISTGALHAKAVFIDGTVVFEFRVWKDLLFLMAIVESTAAGGNWATADVNNPRWQALLTENITADCGAS